MKTVNGIKEKQGPHAVVQVFALRAKRIQLRALPPQLLHRQRCARAFQGLIPCGSIRGGDDADQVGHGACSLVYFVSRRAKSSTRPLNTSSRSFPLSARASCAVSNPYFPPIS